MHRLPEDRRLDVLLKDENSLWQHVQILTEHIVYVHTKLISPISNGESAYWGSYEQLYAKLLHNLDLLGLESVASTNIKDLEPLSWLKEKPSVGAAISIVYDDLPQLGANLLEVAQMRLESLVAMRHIP